MYQSYNYSFISWNAEHHLDVYKITIIDSDFTETVQSTATSLVQDVWALALIQAIIRIYSDRHLNVSKNLFLLMDDINKNSWYKFKFQIEDYIKYIPEFKQYLPEIYKYIILS